VSGSERSPSLAKNTLFNVVDTGVRHSLALVLSPILFWSLGAETYGLWSVIWAFSGSLGLVDLRVNAAMTPLVATAHSEGNTTRVIRLVNNGLMFYGAVGGLIFCASYGVLQIQALQQLIPETIRQDAGFAVPAAAAVFSLSTLLTMSNGILHGLQRYDITATIKMSLGALRALLLISVALLGGGLQELVVVEVAVSIALFCWSWISVMRFVPGYRLSLTPEKVLLRELLSFGSRLQVGHVTHLIALHFDKLILSALLGLQAVAFYDLGAKIVGIARTLPPLLVSATMPVASALHAAGKKQELWTFFREGTQGLAWLGLPLFLWVSISAESLLISWAGVATMESQSTLWLLSVGFFVKAYSEMGYLVIVGIGRPDVEMKRSLIAAAVNVVLSTGLIKLMGFAGAPLGTSLALCVGAGVLFVALVRHFGRSFGEVISPLFLPLLTGIPAGAAAYAIMQLAPASRYGAIPYLAGAAVAIGLIYLASGWATGVFRGNSFLDLRRRGKHSRN
jgi:O-antigen/teichoic acid export membrane protein